MTDTHEEGTNLPAQLSYRAGVKNRRGTIRRETKPALTAEQTTLLIEAYRDLVSKSGPPAPPRKFVEDSARRFGVWIFMVKKALSADERANRELYAELRVAGKRRAAEKEAQRKAERKPRQEGASGKPLRKAGKRRGSVWTVGGGLPGMGRRS